MKRNISYCILLGTQHLVRRHQPNIDPKVADLCKGCIMRYDIMPKLLLSGEQPHLASAVVDSVSISHPCTPPFSVQVRLTH